MSKREKWDEQLLRGANENPEGFGQCLAIVNDILNLQDENLRGLKFAAISYLLVAISWWLNANLNNPELTTLPAFGTFAIAFVHSLFYFSINRPKRYNRILRKSNDLMLNLLRTRILTPPLKKSDIMSVSRVMMDVARMDKAMSIGASDTEESCIYPIEEKPKKRKQKPKRDRLTLAEDGELVEPWIDEDDREMQNW